MNSDEDIQHALATISARLQAIEGAIAALAPSDARRALARFDKFEEELLDRFVGLPVEDKFLDLLRQSFADLRTLLEQEGPSDQ